MKTNFDIISYCSLDYDFLAKTYIYLQIIRKNEIELDYRVINVFLSQAKKSNRNKNEKNKCKYCFNEIIMQKVETFLKSGKNVPEDENF